jgi:phosphatidylserine/phosphatidylglycerophosphate/cardiolipin synthase-like enzyme
LVQAYSFTSDQITQALIDVYKRGIKVEIILDKSQRTERYTKADTVAQAGIPTLIDSKHAIAHNKIMIIDGKVLITGSFNFTASAEDRNAENLLIIKDQPELVRQYEENYTKHKEHSDKYDVNMPESKPPEVKDNTGTNKEEQKEITVYITKNGRKYHRGDCKWLYASRIAITLKEAKARGYEACKVCDPPK